jgi:hypothetical protein
VTHVANVVIDSGQVGSDLTDFRVYVDLSDLPAAFWDTVADGGGDIRCYKSDGSTELAREVVFCDQATDTGELHILYAGTLSSSSDTTIQIHCDGSSSDYAVDATYGRNAVWDASIAAVGYAAVYHLHEDPSGSSPQLTDSTGNGNDMTIAGGTWGSGDSVSGQLAGNALDFDEQADYANTGNNPTGIPKGGSAEELTVTCWINADSLEHGPNNVWWYRDHGTSGPYGNWIISLEDSAGGSYGGYTWFRTYDGTDGGSTTEWISTSAGWQYVYVGWDCGTESNTYVDDNSVYNSSFSDTSSTIDCQFGIGDSGRYGPRYTFQGQMDEVRVIATILGAYWKSAEYVNQATPTTFYSASAVGTSAQGVSAGTSSDTAIPSIFRVGSGVSAGTSSDTAIPSIFQIGSGVSAGSSLDTASAILTKVGGGASAGTATDSATVGKITPSSGASAGTSVDTASWIVLVSASGTSAGTSSDTASGAVLAGGFVPATGTSAGLSVDTASAGAIRVAAGTSAGTSTDTGTIGTLVPASGASAGVSSDTALGLAQRLAYGISYGLSTGSGIPTLLQAGQGSSDGTSSDTATGTIASRLVFGPVQANVTVQPCIQIGQFFFRATVEPKVSVLPRV